MGMRWLYVLVLAGVLAAGCAQKGTPSASEFPAKGAMAQPAKPATTPKAIVTPGGALPGKVVLVNPTGRFVVLSFPMGAVPGPDHRLSVYRQGLKVGIIRITGPQREQNTVGDILSGDCQVGDEVKEE